MNLVTGRGGLPLVRIETAWSAAEIYLQGATVTHFQRHGEPPLLFLSDASRFEPDTPIRGGIPIIFPWFGKPEGRATQHGFARNRAWDFVEAQRQADGRSRAVFRLPTATELPGVNVEYHVTVGLELTVELVITNLSPHEITFENCLHTYFAVDDIHGVSVAGLEGVEYLDALDGRARKTELTDAIQFGGEVDRLFVNTPHAVEIRDAALSRTIHVAKEGSLSTVVWNPWIAKAQAMADFGDDEYQRMVCVESGNCAENAIQLDVGQESRLKIILSSVSW
jgi:glucose-6-phosphate 1-epimerase